MRRPVCLMPLLLLVLLPAPALAQSLLERTANVSGGWIGIPWVGQLDLIERVSDRAGGLASQPTLALTLGLPHRALAGAVASLQSPVAPNEPDELELFGRLGLLPQTRFRLLDLAVQAGFNTAAESFDGELSLARWLGGVRLLVAGRAFSNAYDDGAARFALAGGASVHVVPGKWPIALAGDVGSLLGRENGEELAWSLGIQVGLSVMTSTLSLHATNAASGTLQGASLGRRGPVRFGLHATSPLPIGHILGLFVPREIAMETVAAQPAPPPPPARTVHIDIRNYAFRLEQLEIPAGTTIEWRNAD